VKVSNVGAVDSDEVVQVYASWKLASGATGVVSTPTRQLVGFQRVFVPAGVTKEVEVVIAAGEMAVLNATGSFVPEPPTPAPPGPPFNPCDGTCDGGKCGLLNHSDFDTPGSWAVTANSTDECCESCRAANGTTGHGTCVAWTLTWCKGDGSCTCWMHSAADGFKASQGATAGVVLDRMPPFPPCPKPVPPPPPTTIPVWTVVPGTVELSVGGQQPGQPIAAPSNVLSTSFAIKGNPTPLDTCGQH